MVIPLDFPQPIVENRKNIENHFENLQYKFRGQSAILPITILAISYIRRRPDILNHALAIFFRIMDEQAKFVSLHLSPRFLVSVVRTFAEHGRTEKERLLGLNSYTHASLIRSYETERKSDGLPLDVTSFDVPVSRKKITGDAPLANFLPGNDDAGSSINLLLLMAADASDPISLFTIALLAEVKHMNTIFSRADQKIAQSEDHQNRYRTYCFGKEKVRT